MLWLTGCWITIKLLVIKIGSCKDPGADATEVPAQAYLFCPYCGYATSIVIVFVCYTHFRWQNRFPIFFLN